MKIWIKLFRTLLLSFCNVLSLAALPFVPMVHNFSPSDYSAGMQNWSVCQDSSGLIYIGNNQGLLEFNGNKWTLYELPNKDNIRSVFYDNTRIYVGSYEEFGYFVRNKYNRLEYHSLSQGLKNYQFDHDEIWNIFRMDSNIVFQSFSSFFIYNGEKTTGFKSRQTMPLNMFYVNGKVYSQEMNGDFYLFKDLKFTKIFSRNKIGNSSIISVLSYNQTALLLITDQNGIFLFQNNKLTPFKTDIDADLKANTANRAIMTKDSLIIIGTLAKGIYAIDLQGKIIWQENTETDLINNTVLGLLCDNNDNIWAALDNGIALIRHNSSIYLFNHNIKGMGMIYDGYINNNDMYLASNQGLYCYNFKAGQLNEMSGLSEQSWFITSYNDQIICGHNKGTFLINNQNANRLSDVGGAMCATKYSTNEKEYLIIGTYSFPVVFINRDNRWTYSNTIDNLHLVIQRMVFDNQNYMWVEDRHKGIFRIKLNENLTDTVSVNPIYLRKDHQGDFAHLMKYNGKIVISTSNGYLTFDEIQNKFIPFTYFDKLFKGDEEFTDIKQMSTHYVWLVSNQSYTCGELLSDTFIVKARIPFTQFYNPPVENEGNIFFDANENTYLCLNGTVARYKNHSPYPKAYKNDMQIGNFWVKQRNGKNFFIPLNQDIILNSNTVLCSIEINFPDFILGTYDIRYKIIGHDEEWQYPKSLEIKLSNLNSGNYKIVVQALNGSNIINETSLEFLIKKPWYITIIAIIIYIIAFLLIIWGLLYFLLKRQNNKRLRELKEKELKHITELERQEKKIVELQKNKLEEELKFKSKELSEVTLVNISHQEFLSLLRNEIIKHRNSKSQDNKKFLDTLQEMIQSNIVSEEESWQKFQSNFDRIHENFFRTLVQTYPNLTTGDLRLCALLRLNMSTKDIASMMNISVRGVDAARYRLRKKLNLSPDENITGFLIAFKRS